MCSVYRWSTFSKPTRCLRKTTHKRTPARLGVRRHSLLARIIAPAVEDVVAMHRTEASLLPPLPEYKKFDSEALVVAQKRKVGVFHAV